MNAHSLLSELEARGAVVSATGDRLRLQADVGVVWDDLRPAIQTLKPELLALLQSDPLTPGAIPPADGLGVDFRLLKNLCRDDVQALDLLDQATKNGHGGDRKSEEIKLDNVKLEKKTETPDGNSEASALRRLRKDAKAGFPNGKTDGAGSLNDSLSERQTQRIRRLAATVTADELLSAHRTIKPALQKSLSKTDLRELALTLAAAQKRENRLRRDVYRPARTFYPRDVYEPSKAKGDC
jgi:hypothetical protein